MSKLVELVNVLNNNNNNSDNLQVIMPDNNISNIQKQNDNYYVDINQIDPYAYDDIARKSDMIDTLQQYKNLTEQYSVLQNLLKSNKNNINNNNYIRSNISTNSNTSSTNSNTSSTNSNTSTDKDLFNYLLQAEGKDIHWNKTEKGFTTPLGVYSHLFPNAEPVKYTKQLAKKYGINLNNRDPNELSRFNKMLNNEEKQTLYKKSYDFLVNKFMDKKVTQYLTPEEKLVYFSLAVNGGKTRGNKAIQSALGLKTSGKIDNTTIDALKNRKRNLNSGMLTYMQGFYNTLVNKNPSKYGLYANGWHNRLTTLAKKTNTNWS